MEAPGNYHVLGFWVAGVSSDFERQAWMVPAKDKTLKLKLGLQLLFFGL